MSKVYIIKSKKQSNQLNNMLQIFTESAECLFIEDHKDLPDLSYKKIVFCLELNEIGYCPEVFDILLSLNIKSNISLIGSTGCVLVHSSTNLFTKDAANNLIFLANKLGCNFIGHPLVEATPDLNNFLTWQKSMDLPLEDICIEQCKKLCRRLLNDEVIKFENPRIIALHASSRNTSNTLMLWNMIKANLVGCSIEDLNVENGAINDCTGCSFTTCIHFSKQNSCFYGGMMVSEVFPAIEQADAVVMVCPNYNDAVSANLTAVINRTTALYRKMSFYEKYLFCVVVSGNSGSDSVAKQLIGALNINKGFRLPSRAVTMETANDPGSIRNVVNIEAKAKLFSENILSSIKK